MNEQQEIKKSMSTFWRVFPGIAFALALCAIVIGVYGNTDDKNNQLESRYLAAKKIMSELIEEGVNRNHIDKWHKLSDEFFVLYANKIQWEKSAAALFLAAEAKEILANYTLDTNDYKLAVERYEQLALNYRNNALADDALYRAAAIRIEQLKDVNATLKLLEHIIEHYRQGDMLSLALKLKKNLNSGIIPANIRKSDNISGFMKAGPYIAKINPNDIYTQSEQKGASGKAIDKATMGAAKKEAEKIGINKKNKDKSAQLTKISWNSKTGTQVEIIIELDKATNWKTILQKNQSGANSLDRIVLELDNAVAIKQVRSGAKVQGSLLTQISIHNDIDSGINGTKGTRVDFDFKAVKGYDTKVIKSPYKLIILVDARKLFKNKGRKQSSKDADIIDSINSTASKSNEPRTKDTKKKADEPKNRADLALLDRGKSLNLAEQLGLGVRSIFIDAGHGGRDPGAVGNKIIESKITLDVATRLGTLLKRKGFEVHYSRTKDIAVRLSSRSQKANNVKSDLFISLHVNANTDARVAGFEAYYLDFATTKRAAMVATLENAASDRTLGQLQTVMASIMLNEKKHESIKLANDIKETALLKINSEGFRVDDGGVKSAPFHVLIDVAMPAVLIEIGYCSNFNDAKRLANPKYRQTVAEGIANGIIKYNARFKAGGS